MRVAVISDLHLGAGDAADRFAHDDGLFLRFLRHLEGEFERIVLLGDIWETLTARRLGDHRAQLQRAMEAHPEIARRLRRPRYVYVHGNHDLVAHRVLAAPTEVALEADGVRLLFTHGHQHDGLLHRLHVLAEAGAWIGGWLLHLGLEVTFRALDGLHTAATGASVDPARCSFRRWALSLAREREADVVVTGHTHLAACEEHGDRLYLNSGSCADGRLAFLALDTRAGRYELHDAAAA